MSACLYEALHKALHEALYEALSKLCPKLTPCCEAAPTVQPPAPLRFPLRRYKGGYAVADFVSSAEGSVAGGGLRSTTEV